MFKKKSNIIISIIIFGLALFIIFNILIKKEALSKYGNHLGERVSENIFYSNTLANKYIFTYKDHKYYYYFSQDPEYQEINYPDIFDAETNKKVITLWEKPQGLFLLDNYIYYAYGKEHRSREFNFHNFYYYYIHYKDYKFARFNLDTLKSEKITRKQYEETWDYQDFRQWRSNVSEPVTSLDVFVFLDHNSMENNYGYFRTNNNKRQVKFYTDNNYDTCFTLKNGSNDKYKESWYEYFIYNSNELPTLATYYSPSLITDSIDDLNRMIANYPEVANITIYQMKPNDFTREEIIKIAEKIITPNKNCIKQ